MIVKLHNATRLPPVVDVARRICAVARMLNADTVAQTDDAFIGFTVGRCQTRRADGKRLVIEWEPQARRHFLDRRYVEGMMFRVESDGMIVDLHNWISMNNLVDPVHRKRFIEEIGLRLVDAFSHNNVENPTLTKLGGEWKDDADITIEQVNRQINELKPEPPKPDLN